MVAALAALYYKCEKTCFLDKYSATSGSGLTLTERQLALVAALAALCFYTSQDKSFPNEVRAGCTIFWFGDPFMYLPKNPLRRFTDVFEALNAERSWVCLLYTSDAADE